MRGGNGFTGGGKWVFHWFVHVERPSRRETKDLQGNQRHQQYWWKLDSVHAAWLPGRATGTGTDVINLPDGKVVLNGHSAKATALEFSVPFDGKSDTLTSSSNQLSFALEVGKLSYLWVSSTGTITTTSKGQSGTFSVTFDPSATGVATGNDHATKPLHVSGSWTSCTPWP